MKKQILISTILASSLIGLTAPAFANGNNINLFITPTDNKNLNILSYNSQQGFNINSGLYAKATGNIIQPTTVNYKNLNQLTQALNTAAKNYEAIQIDTTSIRPLLTDIANNKGKAFDLLQTAFAAKKVNISKEELKNFIDFALAQDDETLKSSTQQLLASLLGQYNPKKDPNPSEKIINKIDPEISSLNSKIEAKYEEVMQNIKRKNASLAAIIKEKKELQEAAVPNEKRLAELTSKINSSPEMIALRNHPDSQEYLKKAINIIKNANSSNDPSIKKVAMTLIEEIKNDEGMIFADPKNVSIANLPAVQKPDTHTTSSILNTAITHSTVLNDRIISFAGTGVASGDEKENYGVWIKGNFGTGSQKAFKNESGYGYSQKGATIGVDAGEESIIGLAYSFFQNDVKSKTAATSKDKIHTHMISVYGLYTIQPEIFLSGQASYGINHINKSRATGDRNNNIAKAKTNGNTIAVRAEVGYVYSLNNSVLITPTIGLAYTNIDVNGYTEKGKGLNRKIAKRISTRTSGLAGVSVKNISSASFSQEIHANMDYAFSAKNPDTKITLAEGLAPLVTPSEKSSKAHFNFGGSVKVGVTDMIDLMAGYDLGLSKKFQSHTGTLKLRVNF